ncbi:hypothetical protein JTB14_028025 [Gonioctena quinquepunctata]|nr:hypothetical protein JTB14_028025 [Gonioctena quinquepunctata]
MPARPGAARRAVTEGQFRLKRRSARPERQPEEPLRGRSGLYYSPPGTSYTIVERPSSVMHHHPTRERDYSHYNSLSSPRGTYLGSNPNFSTSARTTASTNNKKRPISPEQVLRLFGSNNPSSVKTNVERPRRSPASSPPSTTHQMNFRPTYVPNVHELTTRTVTMTREPQDGTHGFGICVKGGKEAGEFLAHTS